MSRFPRGGVLAALLPLLLLPGCAQLPGFKPAPPARQLALAKPPESFRLEGRVSVKSGEENFSGGMSWRHRPTEETLLLRTPLGQGVAELHGTSAGVSLTDAEGRRYLADDAEQLVSQVVGMTLPMKGLTWWVVGHPRPGVPYTAEVDAAGRLALLRQDGWHIEFGRYAPQGVDGRPAFDLPGKLVARRGEDLEVRLVVDEWDLR